MQIYYNIKFRFAALRATHIVCHATTKRKIINYHRSKSVLKRVHHHTSNVIIEPHTSRRSTIIITIATMAAAIIAMLVRLLHRPHLTVRKTLFIFSIICMFYYILHNSYSQTLSAKVAATVVVVDTIITAATQPINNMS